MSVANIFICNGNPYLSLAFQQFIWTPLTQLNDVINRRPDIVLHNSQVVYVEKCYILHLSGRMVQTSQGYDVELKKTFLFRGEHIFASWEMFSWKNLSFQFSLNTQWVTSFCFID